MMKIKRNHERTRAQESSSAIERLYITMRHLFNRGFYKPMGVSGETLRQALLLLSPEIYGSIGGEKAELEGLLYVMDRLPFGIEECIYINLTSDEGYSESHLKPIVPAKRRRNCYRIDEVQMNIEITRGRSEIYDILTHLTFLFVESHKISDRVLIDEEGHTSRDWLKLEEAINKKEELSLKERELVVAHLANILGRTFEEVMDIYSVFSHPLQPDRLFHVIYWIGKLAIQESKGGEKRTISFSRVLRERLGQHLHGEIWANNIKKQLKTSGLVNRPIHIISANMHSVMNTLFARKALAEEAIEYKDLELYQLLSKPQNEPLRKKVERYALSKGMILIKDQSGTNVDVQLFDLAILSEHKLIEFDFIVPRKEPILLVMDYAFGEQAFETMDELLKPYENFPERIHMDVKSISIMGKAGILHGEKGDIMVPSAHIFEGTADNYPFSNELSREDLLDCDVNVYEGTMVTVLGTSLQNKEILKFFRDSTWKVIGLEMEGVHYQKAIQAASKVRGNINENVKVRYAYYASDNPLVSGSTLASGGLGESGVKPTYLITEKIINQIIND